VSIEFDPHKIYSLFFIPVKFETVVFNLYKM